MGGGNRSPRTRRFRCNVLVHPSGVLYRSSFRCVTSVSSEALDISPPSGSGGRKARWTWSYINKTLAMTRKNNERIEIDNFEASRNLQRDAYVPCWMV
jgi:hypothetical protein